MGIVLPLEQADDADAPLGYPEIRGIARTGHASVPVIVVTNLSARAHIANRC